MSEIRENYLERNGCRLYYRVQGRGPLLMLIHGVASDADYFSCVAEMLDENFTVVTYDRRGYSRSIIIDETQDTEENASVEEQANDAVAIAQMVSTNPFILVGCSAGGIVSLEIARAFPEKISRLFLYETAYTIDQETLARRDAWQAKLEAAAAKKSFAKAMLLFVEAIGARDPEGHEVGPAELQNNVKNLGRFMYLEMKNYLSYSRRRPEITFAMKVECGVGSLDRGNLFYDMMTETSKMWGVSLTELTGTHNLALDRPTVFAGWIKEKILSHTGGKQ